MRCKPSLTVSAPGGQRGREEPPGRAGQKRGPQSASDIRRAPQWPSSEEGESVPHTALGAGPPHPHSPGARDHLTQPSTGVRDHLSQLASAHTALGGRTTSFSPALGGGTTSAHTAWGSGPPRPAQPWHDTHLGAVCRHRGCDIRGPVLLQQVDVDLGTISSMHPQ